MEQKNQELYLKINFFTLNEIQYNNPRKIYRQTQSFHCSCWSWRKNRDCSCKEYRSLQRLLLPELEVVLEDFRDNPGTRKTLFDLIAVYKIYPEHPEKKPVLINMDSQAPNKVVLEYLTKQKSYSLIHSEHTYGNSRVDFYLEKKTSW